MLNFYTGYTCIIWFKTVYAVRKPVRFAVYQSYTAPEQAKSYNLFKNLPVTRLPVT